MTLANDVVRTREKICGFIYRELWLVSVVVRSVIVSGKRPFLGDGFE